MKTILIADDEAPIRALYERELEQEGYRVITAEDAQEAIQKTREEHPDIVVLDIRMPGMDGIEAMGRLLEENNELPIVINTAYTSYRDSFLSWSADAYITKSSDLDELKKTIHEILDQRQELVETQAD